MSKLPLPADIKPNQLMEWLELYNESVFDHIEYNSCNRSYKVRIGHLTYEIPEEYM